LSKSNRSLEVGLAQLVQYSLLGCFACERLQEVLCRVLMTEKYTSFEARFLKTDGEDLSQFNGIKPRGFPTLIGFVDGEAKVGWEGFAALEPSEITEKVVSNALDSFLAVVDEYVASSKRNDAQ
jgi:hypothetical protein